jgi:hypothetical protein
VRDMTCREMKDEDACDLAPWVGGVEERRECFVSYCIALRLRAERLTELELARVRVWLQR